LSCLSGFSLLNWLDEKVKGGMNQNIKELKLQDICKEIQSGNLDYRLAMKMINSLVNAFNTYSDMNLLIDQRETSISSKNLNEVLEVLESMSSMNVSFANKVANVVPNDQSRLRLASVVKTVLNLAGNKYEVFTDYDEALRWLAD
jgi:hypothetical protein